MFKRIAILVLIFTILIMTSSCSPSSAYGVWKELCDQYPDQHGKVQYVSDNDEGGHHVEYDGVDYYVDKGIFEFTLRESVREIPENDVLVGWDTLPFGLWYLDEYYSYTEDDPIFIYFPRLCELYLRNDYNYETDTFVIDGTDKEFVFGDMLYLSSDFSYRADTGYPHQTYFMLYSKQCPRLKTQLRLICVGDRWYVGGETDAVLFKVSNPDMFLNMLNTTLGGSTH